ncbi:hypothetical protein [Ignatzschineria cameli]|uniref:hypothetical protein n=1 Tax=Ignatzschineria cameli TaxID=2182793 RepID=UPI000D61D83E|nr:hypothetical protein [Ignatzschineria cameli]PWD87445.1 hypothetical protein DC080_01080 [Ignatzschineria cameli]
MLFAIDPKTPKPKVMECLNEVFVHFFEKAVNGRKFEYAFKGEAGQACLDNDATKKKFEAVWCELKKVTKTERQRISSLILNNQQNLDMLLSDLNVQAPCLTHACTQESLIESVKNLGEHLYYRTSKLQSIIDIAGETLSEHYQKYKELNTSMCKSCGTRKLMHDLASISADEQWRSDYDHILVRSKYPIYSVHPDNFMPLCDICNQKAKSSKDILLDESLQRTISFNPYNSDVCESYIEVSLIESSEGGILPELYIQCSSTQSDIQQKYVNWERIYLVPERVVGEKSEYQLWIKYEVDEDNFEDFKKQIKKRSLENKQKQYAREWWFWEEKLFQWIVANQQEEAIWDMLNAEIDLANERGTLDDEFLFA